MSPSKQMGIDKIPKLLLKFSLPAIIGLLVSALYNIVDSIFVGRGVGSLGLAGVTVGFPIIIIFMACIMLIGMGATALISLRLGENKILEAEQIVGNAFMLFSIVGLGLTIFGLLFLKPILTLFGASAEVLPYATDYMGIILFGSIFFTIGTGMNNFIRAEGNPKVAMYTMLIGAVANIVLDYVFIFIFHWGMKGAAAATVISYVITSTWVLYYFLRGNSILRLHLENLRLKTFIVTNILIMGFPSFILQMTGSIQRLILNRSLAYYGGDHALAVIGILGSIVTFLVMPATGISQGAQPIIGFNYGAKKLDRVKDTLKLSIVSATAIVTFGFIVSKIWPQQLIGLFTKDPALLELGTHAMGIFFMLLPLIGMELMSSSYFQAVGKPKHATILGLSRQLLIFIPFLIIFPYFWGLEGIWWSSPFSDLGAFLLTGAWLWVEIKSLSKENS